MTKTAHIIIDYCSHSIFKRLKKFKQRYRKSNLKIIKIISVNWLVVMNPLGYSIA